MLGDKQEQKAEGGSTAIQAGNNIYIRQGMSIADAREVFQMLLRESLPFFQDEARKAAEQNFTRFAKTVEEKLYQRAGTVVLEKLADPDVQATINDAFRASARRGKSSDIDALSNLIVERMSKNSTPYRDIVISEAINVVPKLTRQQISFISFYFSVRMMSFRLTIPEIESIYTTIRPILNDGLKFPFNQLAHLEYAGCCSVNTLAGGNIFQDLNINGCKHLSAGSPENLMMMINKDAPVWGSLIQSFIEKNLYAVTLTSVGQAIALSNISTVFPGIDFGIWIS
ncbi:LPO_1073/Vpar_1526 family protein [Nitrospirillum viridazoti]|uniref:Uncharacterized protein n=1 Tax=Nitrospirillum amazonense TaxID=28077 RepID=A0A560IDE6_9PROT|nr:LPO_1073/Vpar_1526 family protein [Nitrospirillum amazonense]TWB56111.1 hypothetical protein FBZ92_113105 [Nitrospirillum amazonense]